MRRFTVRRLRNDDGSTLPLIIFYGFLCLVLVLLVVAATSLYIERKRLFTLADGTAVVGAEAFDLSQVRSRDDGLELELRSADVAAAVDDYLDANPQNTFESLRVERADSPDGRSAEVTLSAAWRPPVLTLFVPDGIRLEVTAVARSVFT